MTTPHTLLEYGQKHLLTTYRQPPLVMVRGEGSYLFDAEGQRYLDLTGGISVNALGHAHPQVAEAIGKQARTLGHVSNLFYNDQANLLAHTLCQKSALARVFFANSGAEANEAAIKLARRYFYDLNPAKPRFEIISATQSFHGRSMGALAATGQAKYHEGFAPLPPGFRHVTYGDIAALEQTITPETALIMLEPMQGEGGVVIPPPGYLKAVRALCDRHGILLHFDEVQVGMGRTGRWFCHQHDNVLPDTMSLAKTLGGGLALGALLAAERVSEVLKPGMHASTFGGNPIACAAALATIEVFEAQGLIARAAALGDEAIAHLRSALEEVKGVREVRGRGCLIGIELERPVRDILALARAQNLLVTVSADHVLRIAPAYNIDRALLLSGLDTLVRVIRSYLGHAP